VIEVDRVDSQTLEHGQERQVFGQHEYRLSGGFRNGSVCQTEAIENRISHYVGERGPLEYQIGNSVVNRKL
jgi:hypothetical protein